MTEDYVPIPDTWEQKWPDYLELAKMHYASVTQRTDILHYSEEEIAESQLQLGNLAALIAIADWTRRLSERLDYIYAYGIDTHYTGDA